MSITRSPKPLRPDDWAPQPSVAQRLTRAISAPVLVGGAVLLLAVVIAITMVLLRPHSIAGDEAGLSAESGVSAAEGSGLAASGADGGAGGGGSGGGADGDPASASGGPGAGERSNAAPNPGTAAEVYVHVVGEVKTPGVYSLPSDARVEAALEAAGGATKRAVLSCVNLARTVVDGEQIVVPDAKALKRGLGAAAPGAGASGSSAVGAPAGGGGGGVGGAAGSTVINLNSADSAALQTLPRIGPALAERIIEWRDSNGGFTSVDQLTSVSGIGSKTLDGMRDLVTVQ